MVKKFITQSFGVENPLLDYGIEIHTKDTPDYDISRYTKGWKYEPIYLYDHSGRVFKNYPFSDKWDSGPYGVMFIPENFFNENEYEEGVKSLFEEYTQWAEGEVFDIHFCNQETDLSYEYETELFLEPINIESLYFNDNQELLTFMSKNKLRKKDLYDLEKFDRFLSEYVGFNVFGLIKKSEVLDYSVFEVIGYDSVQNEFNTKDNIVQAYIKALAINKDIEEVYPLEELVELSYEEAISKLKELS